jgi:hypothetical protein
MTGPSPPTRRRFLKALPATAVPLAGCSAVRGESASSIELLNQSPSAREVQVAFVDTSGETVFEGSYDLDPAEAVTETDVMGVGEYRVELTVDGTTTTDHETTFPEPECDEPSYILSVQSRRRTEFSILCSM